MDSRRGLFGDATPFFCDFMPAARIFTMNFLQQVFDDLFFFAAGRGVDPIAAVFEFVTFVNEQSSIAAVVDDELGAFAARMAKRFVSTPPIFFERLAFPGKNRDFRSGDGSGGMVLSRK